MIRRGTAFRVVDHARKKSSNLRGFSQPKGASHANWQELMKLFLLMCFCLLMIGCKGKEAEHNRQGDAPPSVPGPMVPGPHAPGPTGAASSAGTSTADIPATSDPINTAPTTNPPATVPSQRIPNEPQP